MFECCLQRHQLDAKVFDYTWKQNRLSKDKEALKNSVMNVIRKKPAAALKDTAQQQPPSNTPGLYNQQNNAASNALN